MYQCDNVLKMYAGSGLRTIEDWTALGRDVAGGVMPRTNATHHGGSVPLYSRGQTRARTREVSKRK